MVITPDCHPTPGREALDSSNILAPNPRGTLIVTDQPLGDIGRWWPGYRRQRQPWHQCV